MPGPAPKDPSQRRRRNAAVPMTRLPAEGRHGELPSWPLPFVAHHDDDVRVEEAKVWAELWRTPQSVMWDRFGWYRDVAIYARLMALAGLGSFDAGREARLLSDRLGLNPVAMLRLRWEIVEDEVDAAKKDRATRSSGTRLRAVDPAAVGE